MNEKLIIYIKQALEKGISVEKLKKNLIENGWDKIAIDEFFQKYTINKTDNFDLSNNEIKKYAKKTRLMLLVQKTSFQVLLIALIVVVLSIYSDLKQGIIVVNIYLYLLTPYLIGFILLFVITKKQQENSFYHLQKEDLLHHYGFNGKKQANITYDKITNLEIRKVSGIYILDILVVNHKEIPPKSNILFITDKAELDYLKEELLKRSRINGFKKF